MNTTALVDCQEEGPACCASACFLKIAIRILAEKVPLGKDPAIMDPSGVNPEDVRQRGATITSKPGNADA